MKKILFSLIFIILLGCISDRDKYIQNTLNELEKVPNFSISKYNYVVIIPGAGCSGCISEAESFFLENSNDSIYFVFTNIYSLKYLKLRTKNKINNSNVFIDKENKLLNSNIQENIYPIIFNLKNKSNIKYDFLDPGLNLDLY